MNEIKLIFNDDVNCLIGKRDGFNCYKKQLKKKLIKTNINKIIFPNNIKKISASFIEGLISSIDKQELIIIITSDEFLNAKIESILSLKNKNINIQNLNYSISKDNDNVYEVKFNNFSNICGFGNTFEEAYNEALSNLKFYLEYIKTTKNN